MSSVGTNSAGSGIRFPGLPTHKRMIVGRRTATVRTPPIQALTAAAGEGFLGKPASAR